MVTYKCGLLSLVLCFGLMTGSAQRYMTRNGFAGFYSQTPLEDIAGENNQVYAVLDLSSGQLAFSLLMKGFIFRKELMQEHFNENYVESDKYPKAGFSGTLSPVRLLAPNTKTPVTVKGNLTIHQVTRPVELPAFLTAHDNELTGEAEFRIRPEDYGISIPSIVRDKIAEWVTIKVRLTCTRINQ